MSKPYPKIYLKPGRQSSLERFHLWVFSGAIQKIEGVPAKGVPAQGVPAQGVPKDGDVVEVYSTVGQYLATGHYQKGSITVRICTFTQQSLDPAFWQQKLQKALALRQHQGFLGKAQSNVFRLVHGEGDGLPGLVIDYYNGVAVLQAHSVGMYRIRQMLAQALQNLLGANLVAVYDKSRHVLNLKEFEAQANSGFLLGQAEAVTVQEYGHRFLVDFVQGQKTGFFVDQRENRQLLGQYSAGKSVLNVFAYTGGFSVYAAAAGATRVHSVDVSAQAVDLIRQNMALNGFEGEAYQAYAQDAFDFLKEKGSQYQVVVLDPPAFAKHKDALHNALKGYRRLNALALKQMPAGSVLFTFSCSQVVSPLQFRQAIFSAAAESGREVRILHQLTQPQDHPINIYHPEGEYLKGLVLYVY